MKNILFCLGFLCLTLANATDLYLTPSKLDNNTTEIADEIAFGRTSLINYFNTINQPNYMPTEQFQLQVEEEIQNQAKEFYDRFKEIYPDNPVKYSYWMSLWKKSVASFKVIVNFNEMIRNYGGTQIASISLATAIVTTFILPPIFTFIGLPVLAGLSIGIPWGVIAGAGIFSWKISTFNLKLLKELNLSSLDKLNKIKMEIIGYDIKNHVTSIIFRQLKHQYENQYEFNIIQEWQRQKLKNEYLSMNIVTVEELETIVRNSGDLGAHFFEDVKSDNYNLTLYTTKLLIFIEQNSHLRIKLKSLLNSRIKLISKFSSNSNSNISSDSESLEAKKLLYKSYNFQKRINLKMSQIREFELKFKPYRRNKLLDKKNADKMTFSIEKNIEDLVELKNEITKAEYHYLLEKRPQIMLEVFELASEVLEKTIATSLANLEYKLEDLKVREKELATDEQTKEQSQIQGQDKSKESSLANLKDNRFFSEKLRWIFWPSQSDSQTLHCRSLLMEID